VYLIESTTYAGWRYIGITSNVSRRLAEHNQGKSTHTVKYRPWKLTVIAKRLRKPIRHGNTSRAPPFGTVTFPFHSERCTLDDGIEDEGKKAEGWKCVVNLAGSNDGDGQDAELRFTMTVKNE
jgi:hypothetical protein